MAKFKAYNVDQLILLPLSVRDFIPKKHLARLVDRVVETLDTTSIEDRYSELGQNTYHPKILIKLLFYGYALGERSGRMIARRCETDTAYMYLVQMYKPDFRTINDFRKNNIKDLSQYFVDIVRMCKELGLIKIGQINIDSTKIKANAANCRTKDKDGYKHWLNKVNNKIKEILKEADYIDREEDKIYGDRRGDELLDNIDTEEKLKKRLKEITKKFKKDKEKINLTDPDAGEVAYLADPSATHPAYVQRLLFEIDTSEIITLTKKAYENGNAPKVLLVKGPIDYIVEDGEVVEVIDEPSISAMESIGGTGDSLTGILSALIYGGLEKLEACIKAAKVNRIAGKLAQPDPSTPVSKIITNIPEALKEMRLCE